MLQSAFATLLKTVIGKKTLILLLKKFAESTDNLVDDNIVSIIEGGLNSDMEKVAKGVEGLIDECIPEVLDMLERKFTSGKLGGE